MGGSCDQTLTPDEEAMARLREYICRNDAVGCNFGTGDLDEKFVINGTVGDLVKDLLSVEELKKIMKCDEFPKCAAPVTNAKDGDRGDAGTTTDMDAGTSTEEPVDSAVQIHVNCVLAVALWLF